MRSSLCLGFCFAILISSSLRPVTSDDPRRQFYEALSGLKEAYLQDWTYEIQDSRSVLIYPIAVFQELIVEYILRLPEGSSSRTKLSEILPFNTQAPFSLNLSQFMSAPLQELSVQSFYNDHPPAMKVSMADPIYFAYKAFMEWSRIRMEASVGEKPFNPLLTVASIRINSLQSGNFQWYDPISFKVSDRQTINVKAPSDVDWFDYAEFSYPPESSNCTAGALRLQVDNDTSIIFVIARSVSDRLCTAPERLLKILEEQSLETINFTSKLMYVSIPILRVSTIVMPARKLIQLGLLSRRVDRTPGASQVFAEHYESASLIFDPDVPKDAPIPMISLDTPRFEADRPFLVAVLQKENPVPVLAGLIQNPIAGFECCSEPDPIRIAISFLNRARNGVRAEGQEVTSTASQPSITDGQNIDAQ